MMPNEITINGEKYIKKNKTMFKKYDEISYKELIWIVIEKTDEEVKLLLKNILDEKRIKKYSDDEWYINGKYVAHTSDIRPPFNWDKSYIKNTILPNFLKDLDVDGNIDLLTKEEAENLPKEIRKSNDWYWTKTNYEDSNRYARIWYVGSVGTVYSDDVGNADSVGVRPVITISKSNF